MGDQKDADAGVFMAMDSDGEEDLIKEEEEEEGDGFVESSEKEVGDGDEEIGWNFHSPSTFSSSVWPQSYR